MALWPPQAAAPRAADEPGRETIAALRQLLLLRHAKSSWDDPALSDHARPLNARGRRSAEAMRDAMRDLGLAPDIVLVSSARRTLQTLEALAPWDEMPLIEPMDALYLASPDAIRAVLSAVTETARSVMIIGHNPGLHEFAVQLVGPAMSMANSETRRLSDGYPTGALAEFAVAGAWSALGEGSGRLTRFLSPRDLPEIAR